MAKVRRTVITKLTVNNVRKLAVDDRGKYKYENELNSVLKDIFGPKNIATRFGPKSSEKAFKKAVEAIDFEALVAMMADDMAIKDIRVLVGITRALKSHKYTKKESKRLRKAYKQITTALVDEYDVKKSDFSDILSQVDKILDDGFYGLDDDDFIGFDLDGDDLDFWDDDDDSPYAGARSRYRGKKKKKGRVNDLARLLYGKDLVYDDDDDADEVRDLNIAKIIKVLERLDNRVGRLEDGDEDDDFDFLDDYEDDDYDEPPRRKKKGSSSGYKASDIFDRPRIDAPDLVEQSDAVVASSPPPPSQQLSAEGVVLRDFMVQVSGDISDLATGFKGMRADVDEIANNVADIMRDFYDGDSDDDDDDDDDEQTDGESADSGPPGDNVAEPAYPIRDSEKKKGQSTG